MICEGSGYVLEICQQMSFSSKQNRQNNFSILFDVIDSLAAEVFLMGPQSFRRKMHQFTPQFTLLFNDVHQHSSEVQHRIRSA